MKNRAADKPQSSGSPVPGNRGVPGPARLLGRPAAPWFLIVLFLLLAFGADLAWSSRKSYFATYTYGFKNFTVLHPVPAGHFFTPGGGGQEIYSPIYMGLLRAAYALIPHRLTAMRVLSIICAAAALYFLYRMARRLLSSSAAAVFLFLLATSPIYLESMRAYGYQSLSQLAVILTVYFTLSSRRTAGPAAAALTAFSTLALYVTARPAAAFPVLYYLLDGKNSWKRLLIYLAVFAGLVTGTGLAEKGSLAYPWSYFASPEEQAGLWPVVEGRVLWTDLQQHLSRNAKLAADYLLGRGRRPFADRESSSRLFNPVYTPFLLLGLVGIWARGRKVRNTVLIMLLLFFVLPLGSREIQPRRILMSVYPLYFLIVIGMGVFWRIILRRRAMFVAPAAAAALLAVGFWDIHEFFFRVARPRLNYPRSELQAVARYVEDNWREVPHIRYHKEIDELIMGNPRFIPRPEKVTGVANIFAEERRDPRPTLRIFSSAVGDDLIYLYTDPPLRIDRGTLEWAENRFGTLVRRGAVPGTGNLFYLRADFSRIAPNLVFKADEFMRVRIRGRVISSGGAGKSIGWTEQWSIPELFDGDPATSILIDPPGEGVPIAIDFTFGEAVDSPVRSISFRVPADKHDYFFPRADLYGGPDGEEWKFLASFSVTPTPDGGEWRNFEFENPRAWNFYRLEFPGGEPDVPGGRLALAGIWLFDRVERDLKIEEVLFD